MSFRSWRSASSETFVIAADNSLFFSSAWMCFPPGIVRSNVTLKPHRDSLLSFIWTSLASGGSLPVYLSSF